MKFSTKPFVIIGLLLFTYIIWSTGITKIVNTLLSVDIRYISIALLLIPPIILVRVYRWAYIVKIMGNKYPLKKATPPWIIGVALATITPGRMGDFIRCMYLDKDEKTGLGKAISSAAIDRVFDIASLVLLALIGSFVLLRQFNISVPITLFLSVPLFLILIILITRKNLMTKLFKPFFRMFIPKKHKDKIKDGFNEFYKGLILIKDKKTILFLTIVSVASWLISFVQGVFVFLALGYQVPYLFILSVVSIETLISLLPITVSGFGTRELTYIVFFSLLKIPTEAIVSFSLISVTFSWLVVFLGFILWFKKPLKIEI